MGRMDNYRIQAEQAMARFLGYDSEKLIRKLDLQADDQYLYTRMLGSDYRIRRNTGGLERREGASWVEAKTHGEVMTLLDLVCDSREDRFLTGRWQNMQAFGLMFHRDFLENRVDPLAKAIQKKPAAFQAACDALGGVAMKGGDLSSAIELFDGLRIGVLFWAGDEEFQPRVRFLWDENARMYLKYETMHFAVGLLRQKLLQSMEDFA